jgi:dienelactone hydrolase
VVNDVDERLSHRTAPQSPPGDQHPGVDTSTAGARTAEPMVRDQVERGWQRDRRPNHLTTLAFRARLLRVRGWWRVAVVLAAVIMGACGGGSSDTASPASRADADASTTTTVAVKRSTVRVEAATAPAAFAAPPAEWLRITGASGKPQLAAVYRPNDSEMHPAIVVVHGTGGLPAWQLEWSAELAAKGYVVVSGCYSDAGAGLDPAAFLACPGLPDGVAGLPRTRVLNAEASYRAILDATAELDNVQPNTIAVVGVSAGAGVVLSFDDPRVKAIVADSYYRETPGTTAGPVLLLGFTEDPLVPHDKIVAFAQAQQRQGNPVESKYYPGEFHLPLNREHTTEDAKARTLAFLEQHLR